MIREQMGRKTGEEIVRFAEEHGIGAGGLSDFAVVVYGGAGPTHYSDFARGLNFGHTVATPYASVFSAFGSSTTDVLHTYSKSARIELRSPKGYFSDYDFFNGIVTSLSEQARRESGGRVFHRTTRLISWSSPEGATWRGIRSGLIGCIYVQRMTWRLSAESS